LLLHLSVLIHNNCSAQVNGFQHKRIVPGDSIYIISVLNDAKNAIKTNPDSALALNNRGLRHSLSSGFTEGEIAAYRNFVSLYRKSDINLAIDYLGKEIMLIKKTGDPHRLSEAYVLL